MKLYALKNKIAIIAFISLLLCSTCIVPIHADPENSQDVTEMGNKNMGDSSSENSGQGQQHGNQGEDNQQSDTGHGNQNTQQDDNNQNNEQNNIDNGEQNEGEEQQNNEQNQHQHQYRKGDEDGDDVDDQKEQYQKRHMTVEHGKNQTKIRSEWMHNNSHDIFDIDITTENGLNVSFDYGPQNEQSNSHSNFTFIISFTGIIEYDDVNMNGRYDEADTVFSSYDLKSAMFSDLNYSTITSSDGELITRIQTATTDSLFTVILYISGNYSQLQNQTLSPSEMKMDFLITNYSYLENTSSISLETELRTIHTIEIESETFDEKQGFGKQEHEINISSPNVNGFFSWLETALVDGQEVKVNVTVLSSIEQTITEEEKQLSKTSTIYFCYPHGENIVHDPKIGVVSLSFGTYASATVQELISSNNIFVFIGICFLASVLFIGSVFIRKRL